MQHENRCTYDFDGCLHPVTHGATLDGPALSTVHFGWLPLLGRALQSHDDVVVVVHSTWRYEYRIDELREVLGVVGRRVVAATPPGPRYESIKWWLHTNPSFRDYRILDDDPREFGDPLPPELILCDPSTGVSAPEVLAALSEWLGEAKS